MPPPPPGQMSSPPPGLVEMPVTVGTFATCGAARGREGCGQRQERRRARNVALKKGERKKGANLRLEEGLAFALVFEHRGGVEVAHALLVLRVSLVEAARKLSVNAVALGLVVVDVGVDNRTVRNRSGNTRFVTVGEGLVPARVGGVGLLAAGALVGVGVSQRAAASEAHGGHDGEVIVEGGIAVWRGWEWHQLATPCLEVSFRICVTPAVTNSREIYLHVSFQSCPKNPKV